MPRMKKKLSKEEKLSKDRLRKKQKYIEIKNDPELYRIQKEKERKRYLLKKEQKKVQSIKDLSSRAQREQRRRWRENSRKYLKKKEEQKNIQRIIIDNSPPDTDNDEEPVTREDAYIDPLANETSENQPSLVEARAKSILARRFRYKTAKVIKNLKKEIENIKKENCILKKQSKRLELQQEQAKKTLEDTLEKKVNELVRDIPENRVKEIRKKLLFEETISRGFTRKYETLKKTEKRSFVQDILGNTESKLIKYKIKSKVPFTIRKELSDVRKNKVDEQKLKIQTFFDDDINSSVAPGKNEFIQRRRIKKQKRYLTDNLKNMHIKYCKEQGNISYTTFCKYRPYWVVFPDGKRETCLCKLHCNANLLLQSLKSAKITTEGTVSEILVSLCCDSSNENCLNRSCDDCKFKSLDYKEFDNTMKIKYKEWIVEKKSYIGRNGQKKVATITTKKTFEDKPRNIIFKLENMMDVLFKHTQNIVVQTSTIRALKQNLTTVEVLIHVDFSENYSLKFNEEVQSFHFGGSRGQISLHTVVMYYVDNRTGLLTSKSLCTMSQCLNHDASAIWAHIKPVLHVAEQLVPSLSKIHFLSDSPSSQYRNRFIFYMTSQIRKQIPRLNTVTWNYQEAGHGKGAPDGIGAVVKRTADSYVKFGGDVGSFEDFQEVLSKNIKNIDLIVIPDDEVNRKKFPDNVPGFKGTAKVHQVIWSSSLPYSVALRSLSCFICQDSYLPCKHGKHLGMLSVTIDEIETCQSLTYEDLDGINFENGSTLQIDFPTIFNNIDDNMILNEFDGTMFLDETSLLQSAEKKVKTTNRKMQTDVPIDISTATKQIMTREIETQQQNYFQSPISNNIPNSQLGVTTGLREIRHRSYLNKKLDQSNNIDNSDHEPVDLGDENHETPSEKNREKVCILSNVPFCTASDIVKNTQRRFDTQYPKFPEFLWSPVSINIPVTDRTIAMSTSSSICKDIEKNRKQGDISKQEHYTPTFIDIDQDKENINIPVNDHGIAMGTSSSICKDIDKNFIQGDISKREYYTPTFMDIDQDKENINIPVNDHGIAMGTSSSICKDIDKNFNQGDISKREHYTPTFMDIDQDKENMDVPFNFKLNDWIIVQYKIKNKTHYYIGKIIRKDDESREYRVGFLKRCNGREIKFVWPTIPDEDLVSESQIIQNLQEPEVNRRGQFVFKVLPNLRFK